MPKVNKAAVDAAGIMGGGALIMSVLGAETPPASLPQGAFFNRMPWFVSAAPKAIREFGLGSMSSLAQNSAALQVVFSWLHVRWSLSGENAWNVTRRKEGSCRRGWGVGDTEVLLKAGTDGARCEAAFYRE